MRGLVADKRAVRQPDVLRAVDKVDHSVMRQGIVFNAKGRAVQINHGVVVVDEQRVLRADQIGSRWKNNPVCPCRLRPWAWEFL